MSMSTIPMRRSHEGRQSQGSGNWVRGMRGGSRKQGRSRGTRKRRSRSVNRGSGCEARSSKRAKEGRSNSSRAVADRNTNHRVPQPLGDVGCHAIEDVLAKGCG